MQLEASLKAAEKNVSELSAKAEEEKRIGQTEEEKLNREQPHCILFLRVFESCDRLDTLVWLRTSTTVDFYFYSSLASA